MGFLGNSEWLHINNKLIDFGQDKNTDRDYITDLLLSPQITISQNIKVTTAQKT